MLVGSSVEVEAVAAIVRIGREAHVVEDEEFGFRTEIGLIAKAGLLQVSLGLAGDAARVALIALVRVGLKNVAEDCQGRLREERVHMGRLRIGHQRHVAFVDGFPAGNRGAVERDAFGEGALAHFAGGHRQMLQLTARIGEAQIDVLDFFVLDFLYYFVRVCHRVSLVQLIREFGKFGAGWRQGRRHVMTTA